MQTRECGDCNLVAKLLTEVMPVIFSHHQKTIVMDQNGNSVVGFVGGYDIAAGRHNSPLLRMYECTGDPELWYNYIIPWHDIHAKVVQACI